MTVTKIQRIFKPFKDNLPKPVSNLIRNSITALYTPIFWSIKTGHFKSSLLMKSVDKHNNPIPWYTYPCYNFLKYRDFSDKSVLEFGGGQSTIWWSVRAKKLVTLEADEKWYNELKKKVPENIDLHYCPSGTPEISKENVLRILSENNYSKFDVIIIDGLFRVDMINISLQYVSDGGCIIFDDSEGYNLPMRFKESGLQRVDFYGNCPGVILPHCTSILLKQNCFIISGEFPIQNIPLEK